MSLATVYSRATSGINAPLVTVEVHLANGLPAFSIVGLPEKAVQESRERVRGALVNAHFEFPTRKIIVNLAPADLPKDGGRFDLAIAIGILAASGQLPQERLSTFEFVGELALSGEIRPVRGILPVALACNKAERCLILPNRNADEAILVQALEVLGAKHLLSVTNHLNGTQLLALKSPNPAQAAARDLPDLRDVKGQAHARRALEIAAAGGHNLLFLGPPGSGKSMLAHRMVGILPPLGEEEALESAAIASIGGVGFEPTRYKQRPYRSPHHTCSSVALVGGGSNPKPGEISLAHNGVLFLDELPEFDRKVLEVLREPLENGRISIARAARQAEFPAQFQLIAAMNPCPCGHLGDTTHDCRCTPDQIRRYRARLSGPLLDRIDMHVEVPALPAETLTKMDERAAESSAQVAERVEKARQIQINRQGKINSALDNAGIEQHCQLDESSKALLNQAIEKLGLSARAYHRILKLARTIADVFGENSITSAHVGEAIAYRRLDRG